MTNAVNVEFIVEKLLSFLGTATDDHFRTDLVGQITQCAERFAPSNAWCVSPPSSSLPSIRLLIGASTHWRSISCRRYVQTMVKVFELAGDKVKMSVAQTLMQLIAEGSEAEDPDEEGERHKADRAMTMNRV